VLGYRCNQQRQLLKLTYKTLFGRVRHAHIHVFVTKEFMGVICVLLNTLAYTDKKQFFM